MENGSVLRKFIAKLFGIYQIAVMSESQSSLNIIQNQGLSVTQCSRPCCGITDMPDTEISFHI